MPLTDFTYIPNSLSSPAMRPLPSSAARRYSASVWMVKVTVLSSAVHSTLIVFAPSPSSVSSVYCASAQTPSSAGAGESVSSTAGAGLVVSTAELSEGWALGSVSAEPQAARANIMASARNSAASFFVFIHTLLISSRSARLSRRGAPGLIRTDGHSG